MVPVEGQSFSSEQDWINRAKRVLTSHPDYNNTEHGEGTGWRGPHFTALCFDQAGRRMRNGGDFKRATEEGAYPVWWVWPDQIAALLTAAPVREEGGAVDDAVKIATDLHHAYEQLIYGLPKYLEAENLTDEENMIREAWITLDVTAHRLAALATREEAPAEAGEEWKREDYGNSTLLYTLKQKGWSKGEPIMVNDKTVRVEFDGDREPVITAVLSALRAQPQAREEAQPVCLEIPLSNHMRVTLEYDADGSRTAMLWNEANEPIADGEAPALTTPPASEAEKLRAAVQALDKIGNGGVYFAAGDMRDLALQALAAQQQEGVN